MATKTNSQKLTTAPAVSPVVSTAAASAAPAFETKKAAPHKKSPAVKTSAPKSVIPKKKSAPVKVNVTELRDEIRSEAYSYFIQRGYRPGDPVADWHRAEDAVLRRRGLR